jgi:hypothetical protein
MSILRRSLVAITLLCGLAGHASADDVVYHYNGALFDHFEGDFACTNGIGECQLTGTLILSGFLPPDLDGVNFDKMGVSFVDGFFSDGPTTTRMSLLNNAELYDISTDAQGNLTGWNIFIENRSLGGGFYSTENGDRDVCNLTCADGLDIASTTQRGTWTVTPEPLSIILFGTCLGMIAIGERRRWSLRPPRRPAHSIRPAAKINR